MNENKKTNFLLLGDSIFYENKEQYVLLMKNFIDAKIDGTEFKTKFFEMFKSDRDAYEILKKDLAKITSVELNPKFERFSDLNLISDLFIDCDAFDPDPVLRDDYEISEEQLRNGVKRTLLQIQEYL